MSKLLIATTNSGKVSEIAALLTGLPYEIGGLDSLPQALPIVEETGATFAENALLKAETYHQQTGLLTLADDSGLAVDALDGRPGVYAARYAGADASDSDKVARLLEEMQAVPSALRTARFVCMIALVGTGIRASFSGVCAGLIAAEPRGAGGFGYDPIFIEPASGRTFAEMSRADKAAVSHRGKALALVREYLAGLAER